MKTTVLALLCLALLSACDGGAKPPATAAKSDGAASIADTDTKQVRVYQVPPEQTDAISQALVKVFENGGGEATGKVSSPAPGQIMVLAPANLQGSVESSLHALVANQAPKDEGKTPPIQVRLSFWSVDALPEDGTDDLELVAIAPALDEVRKQLGGVRFLLRDQVSAVSSPGKVVERSWVGTKLTTDSPSPMRELQYELRPVGDQYMLDLKINEQVPVIQAGNVVYLNANANTSTALRLGQSLVVTQTPIPRNALTSGEVSLADRATRLYVVRADAVPAG